MKNNMLAIILAAGKGSRMKSNLPKVLHKIAGKPMIDHLLDKLESLGITDQAVVYGFQGEQLKDTVSEKYPAVNWVLQNQQLGTGHAVNCAIDLIKQFDRVLILLGDGPLISEKTINQMIEASAHHDGVVLSTVLDDPFGYGRIIKDENGTVQAIVEEKDATVAEKQIHEINTGVMCFKTDVLMRFLSKIDNKNANNEYYLTDIISIAYENNSKLISVIAENPEEVSGINDKVQLAQAERYYRMIKANELMLAGATLIDPERIDVQGEVTIGNDVVIEPNVMFFGKVRLGDNVWIESGCRLKNCTVGNGSKILSSSIIENSVVGSDCQIGPFARIRPDTDINDYAKIGNFVEIKKSTIGKHTKINHLSYIGDANLGENINIGAGTITCNYDGANKFLTEIENNVFVGSNTALVAPLKIGENSTIGAGSVITKEIENDVLAFTRPNLTVKYNWQRQKKEPKN